MTAVVIPVKDRLDLTSALVAQLHEQGEASAVLVYDNGSTAESRRGLDRLGVDVFDAEGWNIHEMWNAGLDEAARRGAGYVAVLNNDIRIGPRFLSGLAAVMDADPHLAAVCPNYDGRPGTGVVYTQEICAGRYDGTGGFAGFAFMLDGACDYRFPEGLRWWFGDNDLLASIVTSGLRAGIALDVTCEHVDGGSQTADWDAPDLRQVLAEDQRRFLAKWSCVA